MNRPAFGQDIRIINRNMRSLLGDQLKTHGILEGQLEYLMTVYENEGINQREIADNLDVGKAAVTKAVRILEKDGFITRGRDPGDRRNYRLSTTDTGKTVGEACGRIYGRLQAQIFEEFSFEELEELTNLLQRLRERTSELTGS